MSKQSQSEIDRMIQRAPIKNQDLVRRDINQCINSPKSNLVLKLNEYYYNDGSAKELLYLAGTIECQYKGSRYYIPIEIWFQQDHPTVAPLVYVKPTADMHLSLNSPDVESNGAITIPYLKSWRYPKSDIMSLLNAMSDAFSQNPPVFSRATGNQATLYPSGTTAMPMSAGIGLGMNSGVGGNPSYPYSPGYQQTQIPQNIYRDSIQTAVVNKIRNCLDETLQVRTVEIDSLRKTEQDLVAGEKKLQTLINDAQQQQVQAQNYITMLQSKTNEMLEATQKMSSSSSGKENSVKDDALTINIPVFKQLLQAYAEEHAIQDLLYHLAEGLRRESIGLDTYLKHVRELSRKQFMLRATMYKCRQVARLPIR